MKNGTTLRPLHDRVIVLPDPEKEQTEGGIAIPESAKERPARGKVIAAGPGLEGRKTEVQPGDTVLYSKHAGVDLDINGEKYLLLQEKEIHVILESEGELEEHQAPKLKNYENIAAAEDFKIADKGGIATIILAEEDYTNDGTTSTPETDGYLYIHKAEKYLKITGMNKLTPHKHTLIVQSEDGDVEVAAGEEMAYIPASEWHQNQ